MSAYDETRNRISVGEPCCYRIVVDGGLDESWSDRLAGLRIESLCDEQHPYATVLEGRVSDQAELIGVLDSLYELHYPILSVELQPDE